jgi:hypothetical protein
MENLRHQPRIITMVNDAYELIISPRPLRPAHSHVDLVVLRHVHADVCNGRQVRERLFESQPILHGGFNGRTMVLIEIALMSAMYPNKKWNAVIVIASVLLLALFWVGIRRQVAISDKQFLRSMIPHHAGAILMCEKASIRDPEIKQLCQEIISSQQREISQMKAKLNELH